MVQHIRPLQLKNWLDTVRGHGSPVVLDVREPSELVAASIKPLAVREGANVTTVPAALSVFRIGSNGKLEFVRKYDVDTGGKIHYWMGMMGLG